MSRKRFDEFYEFVTVEDLRKKISTINICGLSTTRKLASGGFFFGLHDNHGNNKRLAVVFKTKEQSEEVYNQLFGE